MMKASRRETRRLLSDSVANREVCVPAELALQIAARAVQVCHDATEVPRRGRAFENLTGHGEPVVRKGALRARRRRRGAWWESIAVPWLSYSSKLHNS